MPHPSNFETRDDPIGSFIQWMYGERGNREAAWERKRLRGEKVDPVLEAFRAGWHRRSQIVEGT